MDYENLFSVLLGGLLAILGGIIGKRFENYSNRLKEDEALLYEALIILSEYCADSEMFDRNWKLLKISIRIKSRKHIDLAEQITDFLELDLKEKLKNRDDLETRLRLAINKRLEKRITKKKNEAPGPGP